MALYIDNQVDPLAAIDEGRELSSCPVHFVKIPCSTKNSARLWIWKNLTGRFSVQSTFAGFEDPAEASMFALISDQLK